MYRELKDDYKFCITIMSINVLFMQSWMCCIKISHVLSLPITLACIASATIVLDLHRMREGYLSCPERAVARSFSTFTVFVCVCLCELLLGVSPRSGFFV